jgi:competence protein ComEA
MKFLIRFIFPILLALAPPAFSATQVDINSADAKTLAESLDGIGLVKAEAIVAYRNAHGPFASLEDLAKVKGIGPRIIQENRETILFGKPRQSETRPGASTSPHARAGW